ncbi:MAG: sulfatase-like hydrolase/transferase [Eubacterium sp.]|nr:sulfatase-like hydrolase/transferase [Eubacterium sp.]
MIKTKFINKLLDIFPQCCFFIVTFCVFMPCSLFLGNIDEFPIEFNKIIPVICLVSLLIFLSLVVIGMFFLRFCRKIYLNYAVFIFSCALGFYFQGNFLNPHFGELNGNAIDWSEYRVNGIISTVVWILCLILPQIFVFFNKVITIVVTKWGSYFAAAVQIATLIILAATTSKTVENDFVVTKNDQFQLSENNNIIVFIVDTLDAAWFDDVILENKAYDGNLEDFTYFDNAVSGGAPTVLGIPLILTGKAYDTMVTLDEYYKNAYGNSNLFRDLQRNNFDVRLYTSYSYLNGIDKENINNIEEGQEYKITSYKGFSEYLYKLVSFYAMPQMLKQYFWIYSDDFSDFISITEKDVEMYNVDDPQFYMDFMNSGIEKENGRNVFAMYHLRGVHAPYTMNEKCEFVDTTETSRDQQLKGSMKIVFEFISKMKEIGIYDNSTIIIAADHGGIQLYQNPAVLIKQRGVSQEFCKNSNPVTFENLYASIASSFLENYSQYGKDLFDVNSEKVQRLHTASHILGEAYFPDNEIVEANNYARFLIPDDAKDIDGVEVYDSGAKNIIAYKMGEVLRCTTEEAWFEQIKTGMVKDASDAGCRILGNSFEVTFELSDYHNKDLVFHFEYENVYNNSQNVELYVNEDLIDNGICSQANTDKSMSFEIPKEYADNHKIDIRLEFPGAVRPSDLNSESADHRKLSINLVSMELSEKK